MKLSFTVRESGHELECMKYAFSCVYSHGRCEFRDTYFGDTEDLKKLLSRLKKDVMKLEKFISTLDQGA